MSTPATTPAAPASHWYTTLWHVLKHVDTYVSTAFVKLFGQDAAHSFAVGAESLLRSDLGKIAIVAVEECEALAAGVDKRAVALGKIMTAVTSQGLDVRTSLVNLLIELAVARMKGLFGTPAA